MSYHQNLAVRLRNPDKWPRFPNKDYRAVLGEVADQAFDEKEQSRYAYLAAVVIYQQLAEEMIHLLLECSDFYLQLAAFPAQLNPPKHNGKMFGRLLDELRATIEFPHKRDIIEAFHKLNQIRIGIVHRLAKDGSLKQLEQNSRKAYSLYDKVYIQHFDQAYDWFLGRFDEFKTKIKLKKPQKKR